VKEKKNVANFELGLSFLVSLIISFLYVHCWKYDNFWKHSITLTLSTELYKIANYWTFSQSQNNYKIDWKSYSFVKIWLETFFWRKLLLEYNIGTIPNRTETSCTKNKKPSFLLSRSNTKDAIKKYYTKREA